VTPKQARVTIVAALAVGLVLAAVSGGPTLFIAIIGIGIGLLYDLALKGTAWSWLPFALGVPLVPVFGWLGATGSLPRAFAVLVPAAFVSGAALAIANALADVERDRSSGNGSIAVALGSARAWVVDAILVVLVCVAAIVSAMAFRGPSGPVPIMAVVIAAALPLAGVGLSRGAGAGRRERGWEVQAVGFAALAAAWLAAVLT
jgi:4-hydroxybenzoate polyprenyltransferase